MKTYNIKLTLLEPMLGTIPKNPEIYKAYIASKAPKENNNGDELETVEDLEEKNWTGFHMVDGNPILYDYVIKGFFKDACSMLRRVPGSKSSALKSHKKIIDGLVFIEPRQIPIDLKGQSIEIIERPLRAQTAQGERITLTRSDACPIGSTICFDIKILGGVSKALLTEWLDYGKLRGLGQWRNAGYGRFEYSFID